MQKKLYRSNTDKKITGVCGGIAKYFNIDSTVIRLLFIALVFAGASGILIYLICSFIIPEEPNDYTSYTDVPPENGGSM